MWWQASKLGFKRPSKTWKRLLCTIYIYIYTYNYIELSMYLRWYIYIWHLYDLPIYLSDLYYMLSSPVHIPIQSLPLSYLYLSNYMGCPESQWPMNGKTCFLPLLPLLPVTGMMVKSSQRPSFMLVKLLSISQNTNYATLYEATPKSTEKTT